MPLKNYSNNANQIAGIRFRQSWEAGMNYILSPIVIILIIITLLSVVIGLRQAKNILSEGEVPAGTKRAPLVFLICVIGFIAYALWDAVSIPDYAATDRVFPAFVASISLIGALILLIQMMLVPETHGLFADRENSGEEQAAQHRPMAYISLVCLFIDPDCADRLHNRAGCFFGCFYEVPSTIGLANDLDIFNLGH